MQYISTCVSTAVQDIVHFELAGYEKTKARLPTLVGDEFYTFLQTPSPYGNNGYVNMTRPWKDVPADLRQHLVDHMVNAFLGSDQTIQDFGLIKDPAAFRRTLLERTMKDPDIQVVAALKILAINLALRDEFLSY